MYGIDQLNGRDWTMLPSFADTAPPRPVERESLCRLCFVGDLMLGRRLSSAIDSKPPKDFWGDALGILTGADAVVANLESPITDHPGRWTEGWKAFRFAAAPKAVELLNLANVRAVNLANNHSLDCESQGLADTMRHLGKAGIAHAGAGMNLREAWQPALFRAGPLTVGMIGVTDNMKEFAAEQCKAGTSYLEIDSKPGTLMLLDRLVRELRARGADTVVLSIHWGPNLRTAPPKRFRKFARSAIDLGVDIVHGHSAHLVHGVETYENGVILYDTGDFLDDYWVFPGIRIDHSFAFLVECRNGKPSRLDLIPVKLSPGRVGRAEGEEASRISGKMCRKSRRLGTNVHRNGHLLSVDIASGSRRIQAAKRDGLFL